ncbi:CheR family methyltransferase [Nannocystis pusilla]|uniref:protein-glutamate O-methyltransferase n=1 Tax=Nannocystis pusilla TaxID=889268 RepID=A0ABS7TXZ2_9BACT|nr:protein-glutamate O-methyltransferase CheR [Nannocystis pusilla]
MNGRLPPGGIEPPVRVRITPEESRLLAELILDYCGVLLGGDAGFLLERRLASRLDHLSLGSYLEYYHYLSYDLGGPAELLECIERVTTHETYLFREQFQLDAFQREILPVLLGRRGAGAPVVWSAGCSTGEEAYTIAALLTETARPGSRVIGSDISVRGVRAAEAGIYGPSSFRTTPEDRRERYFEPLPGGQWRAIEPLRRMCTFVHLNLLDTARYRELGAIDTIFCRNVLMYLSNQARRRVVEGFYDALVPGGYLLLGHSESLISVPGRFDLVNLSNDLVYRKPG